MRIFGIVAASAAEVALFFCATFASAAPWVDPPLSAEAIAQFKSNPTVIVAPNSDTRAVEIFVRDLAGTSPTLATDLVEVAQKTTPKFQTAIAAGLAQAAIACNDVDRQSGLFIQQAVAGYTDGQFQASFAAVAGDLSTAATAAAAESAVGAVGSVTIVNQNKSTKPAINPGGSGSTSLVQITSSAVTFSSSNRTTPPSTTTTAANPVSPTR